MNESNLRLSNVQQKAIKALAKADARPVKQMLAMVIHEGFVWVFNEFSDTHTPFNYSISIKIFSPNKFFHSLFTRFFIGIFFYHFLFP